MNNSKDDSRFFSNAIRLTFLIALQNCIVCLVGMVDNIMLGAWSQDSLNGVSLANQIQFLLQMITSGLGEGTVVLTAQYWGAKRLEPIKKILGIAVFFSIALAILFLLCVQVMPSALLSFLTNETSAISEGVDYIRIVSFSYIFFSTGMILNSAQRSVENVKIGIISSSISVVVNMFFNRLFIFGIGSLRPMGVRGAALATVIARFVEFGILLLYTYKIDKRLAVIISDVVNGLKEYLHDFFHVAFPVCLSGLNWGIATSVQTAILGHLGSSAIAASSISSSLFQVISVVAYGMAGASSVLIGKEVGSGDIRRIKKHVYGLQFLYVVCGIISGLILFLLKEPILSFYKVSEDTLYVSRQFIIVLSITLFGTTYQCSCLTGIVRGGGNTGFVFKNDLIFQWLIVIPLSLLSAFVWKLEPVWTFFFLKSDQILKCFVAIPVVNRFRWIKRVTREDTSLSQ